MISCSLEKQDVYIYWKGLPKNEQVNPNDH